MTLKEKLSKLESESEKRYLINKLALKVIKAQNKSFKEQYSQLSPGGQREALVYEYAIKQGKPALVPITVPGPGGTKITYQVMPNFLTIDGIRVTLTPITAQKIANYFNMQLPTAKMAKQIYGASNKIPAKPLSGSGVTIDNKHYSGNDVVRNLISDSKANIAYSNIVDQQIASSKIDPSKPVDGFAKTIVQSEIPGRTSYIGLWTSPDSKPIQGGNGVTPHGLDQTEYCAMFRGVSNNITITKPDGTVINTTLDKTLKTKKLSTALTSSPGKGSQKYTTHKAGPPAGFRSAKLDVKDKSEAEQIAKSLLNKPMWTETTITLSNGKTYVAKVEPHSNAPKGVSLYESSSQERSPTTPSPIADVSKKEEKIVSKVPSQNTQINPKKVSIIDRISDFIKNLNQQLS